MLGIQQRGHNHVQTHGLTLLRCTGHQEVRRIGQVEHLYLLGDGIADGHRKFRLGTAEGIVVEHGLQRHDGRPVVGHLDSHGVLQGNHAYALGIQRHSNIFLQTLDGRDLHAGSRIYLI